MKKIRGHMNPWGQGTKFIHSIFECLHSLNSEEKAAKQKQNRNIGFCSHGAYILVAG